ncbi:MAG: hypothetical protein ACQEQN_03765 [Thermodesulfobacteriota bacterium]
MFLVTVVLALLVVGYLVIQNMDARTGGANSGRVEEVERARDAAAQAKEAVDAIRESAQPDN